MKAKEGNVWELGYENSTDDEDNDTSDEEESEEEDDEEEVKGAERMLEKEI